MRLEGASFHNTVLAGMFFHGMSFDGASFDNADLTGATFRHSSLRRTSFINAKLAKRPTRGAGRWRVIWSAVLSGARIDGASLKALCSTEPI